jgi:hypothetical protein
MGYNLLTCFEFNWFKVLTLAMKFAGFKVQMRAYVLFKDVIKYFKTITSEFWPANTK